jgi:hypothetical protein
MGLSCEGSADASVQSGIFPAVWKESFQEWRKAGYLLISWDIHFIGDTKTITIRPQDFCHAAWFHGGPFQCHQLGRVFYFCHWQ